VSEIRDPELLTVPVRGGDLTYLRWAAAAPGAPVAVLVHGITSNAMVWARVAAALTAEYEVLAPDLRGRAGSAELPAPYGLPTHADDLAALLECTGPAVLAGHSMGAFVAALAAAGVARYAVRGLVLVDGGLPFPQPPGSDVDAQLTAMLGPTLERLGRTFSDLAAVRAFWATHPTVGPWVDVPSIAAFLARDVTGTPPQLRSAVRPEAVRADGADLLRDATVLEALAALPLPAILLRAPRGMVDQPPGLYDDARLAGLGGLARIAVREVADTNHDSILWAPHGAAAVAAAVREATSAGRADREAAG
jgi:pimeloyl-ACP methyl ester carboxylesterase